MLKISEAVASSVGDGIADDALKDEDNGFWLVGVAPPIRAVWTERFYWIRWVDRLAEQDQVVTMGGQQFAAFYQAWKRLRRHHFLAVTDRRWDVLRQIEAAWFLEANGHHQREIEAWDCYMDAIADYHQPQLAIATLRDYEMMLDRLAGACFQLLPFLSESQRLAARQFGILDQFYNNLRDLYEDAQQGVCYIPVEVLADFGLTRQHMLDLSCLEHAQYRSLMHFWVEQYLPTLRRRYLGLAFMQDLHPTWQCLVTWFIHRYLRIERTLRACQYDFVQFARHYWTAVQADLTVQVATMHHPYPWERLTWFEAIQ